MSDEAETREAEEMRKRTITLEDGRYMIFYEFGTESPAGPDPQTEKPPPPPENV
jgi:hypothetical protein